jgi:hypothetical protein
MSREAYSVLHPLKQKGATTEVVTPTFCADSVVIIVCVVFCLVAAIISCSSTALAREIIVLLSCCYCLSL